MAIIKPTKYTGKVISVYQILQAAFIVLKVIPLGDIGNASWWIVFTPTYVYVLGFLLLEWAYRHFQSETKTIHFTTGARKEITAHQAQTLVDNLSKGTPDWQTFKEGENISLMINIKEVTHID